MIRCANCGAVIDDTTVQCPYCDAAQLEASQNKYMNDLYSMNDTMDELDDNSIRTELHTTVKNVIITLCVFAACICLGVLMGVTSYRADHSSSDEKKLVQGYSWYDEHIDAIREYYAKGDFAGLSEYCDASDYDKYNTFLSRWEHSAIFKLYDYYYDHLLNYIDAGDNRESEYSYYAAYRMCLEFLYHEGEYSSGKVSYNGTFTGKDWEYVAQWRKTARDFAINELGLSESELDADVEAFYNRSYEEIKEMAASYYARLK